MDAASEPADQPRTKAPSAPPCTLVILGASGDLTKRLLVPALYNLVIEGLLDDRFEVLGVDLVERDDDSFRQALAESTREFATDKSGKPASLDATAWGWLETRLHYISGDFESPGTYDGIARRLEHLSADQGSSNAIFYLATSPRFFAPIIERLAGHGLTRETGKGWRRVVIEKPFGTDLASARALNQRILAVLTEEQIFRMDHYLGKETVQNIMVLRFANGIFEPLWNRLHIDHVQITAAETVTVERRGRYYDATGALRDMVPNHLFQLLAMTAMEAPSSFDADAVRSEKAKVICTVHPLSPEDAVRNVVRGQYTAGQVEGRSVPAYRQSPDVSPSSRTETYVGMKLTIDNWRWAGVPFYLRTGKALASRRTEIAIRFKQAPYALFRDTPVERLTPNFLVLRIQPNEGIKLRFGAKVPGPVVQMGDVSMDFRYVDYFSAAPSTGYETLIYDCMIGDATLFQRADNVEAGWTVVQPVLDAWASGHGGAPAPYPAGSDGPREADDLLARDHCRWLSLR
jgi:glucose-6-phosphate 1-dehydrogenase